MVLTLLQLALNKIGAKVGGKILKRIMKSLNGKETTIADLEKLLDSVSVAVNMLPQEIIDLMVKLKYNTAIDRAHTDINEANYEGLCNYLDKNHDNSYWTIAEQLCLSMIGLGIPKLEDGDPERIDFPEEGYMWATRNSMLAKVGKKYNLMADYVGNISTCALSLSVALVAIHTVAARALAAIMKCPKNDRMYPKCQEIIKRRDIKKYVTLSEDGTRAGKNGLPARLKPGIEMAPHAIVGKERTRLFLSAVKGVVVFLLPDRWPQHLVCGFKVSENNPFIFPMEGRMDHSNEYVIKFAGNKFHNVLIKAPWTSDDRDHTSAYLYVSKSRRGIYRGSEKSPWAWYIYKNPSGDIVYIFTNRPGKDEWHYTLSTSGVPARADNGVQIDTNAYYRLKLARAGRHKPPVAGLSPVDG